MFRDTKKLRYVMFNECKFTAIDELFLDSDVEVVTFDACSLDDDFNMYTQLSSMVDIFGIKVKRIILNNCDENLVSAIMHLYRNEDYSSFDFEIEIK